MRNSPVSKRAAAAALGAAIALAGAGLYTALSDPLFRASARVLVSPHRGASERAQRDAIAGIEKRWILLTLVEIATSPELLRPPAEALGVVPEAYEVSASPRVPAAVVEIRIDGPDRRAVSELAGAVARGAADALAERYSIYQAELLDADPVVSRVRPRPLADLLVAALVGATLGVASAGLFGRHFGARRAESIDSPS